MFLCLILILVGKRRLSEIPRHFYRIFSRGAPNAFRSMPDYGPEQAFRRYISRAQQWNRDVVDAEYLDGADQAARASRASLGHRARSEHTRDVLCDRWSRRQYESLGCEKVGCRERMATPEASRIPGLQSKWPISLCVGSSHYGEASLSTYHKAASC